MACSAVKSDVFHPSGIAMQFIEFTGANLLKIVNEGELSPDDLKAAGVTPQSLVRINRQGDIELRKTNRWDVIGGLIGNYEERVRQTTGLDWA